ncbi:uncharacterized protein LOC118488381 isoform X3 [Helianthus annuus]|uniref:uncharacterized protein LOC118488381 isoform X3 n=1 Tax=Helianthus annuus TaxID=4232 RepID=UPI001652BEB9|nr:uncharacterized protein LOC118488381 isoform X3 [Helianthus annuus]
MHLLNSLKVAVGDHKKQHSMMLSFCYLFLLLNLIMYQSHLSRLGNSALSAPLRLQVCLQSTIKMQAKGRDPILLKKMMIHHPG